MYPQRCCSIVSVLVLFGYSSIAVAQFKTDPPNESGLSLGGLTVYVGEKAWAAAWDTKLLDAAIVLPSTTSAPVIKTFETSGTTNKLMPVTTLGARFKDFSLTANVIPTTKFSSSNTTRGYLSRSEFDINFGYYFNDYVSVALIYKQGQLSETTTVNAAQLIGAESSEKLQAVLVGLSAGAPIADQFRVFGTLAYGPGRAKYSSLGQPAHAQISYTIGELGVSYNTPSPLARIGVTLTAGYRVQVVELKNIPFDSYSLAGAPLSDERRRITSTTHGPTLGLTLSFL